MGADLIQLRHRCIERFRRTSLIAALLLGTELVADAQFTYTTNSNTITITDYTGPGGVVTVPSTIFGYPVVSVGDYAFDSVTGVTTITIPDSVTSIGTYAFRWCSLTSVTIGNGVKSIGFGAFFECRSLTSVTLPYGLNDFQTYAFRGCSSLPSISIPTNVVTIANSTFFDTGLTNIAIPKSVTSIGSTAFNPCPQLQAITVDALNPVYASDGIALFNKNQTVLYQYPGGKAGVFAVPQSVTNVADSAFANSRELTNVTLGTNVVLIGNQAFIGCIKLAGITLTDRVVSIGSSAFAYCSAMTNLNLGAAVTYFGSRPFASCGKLTNIAVNALNPSFASVDGVLFNRALTSLVSFPGGKAGTYVIPDSVTSIASYAFEASVNLTRVVIPNGITTIPAYAFSSCTSLTNVTIPSTVTLLGDRAFVACSALTAVYFRGNAPWLGSSYVFYNANKASIYYLPGTTGWGSTFGGRPAALWNPTPQTADPSFGVHSNRFAFTIRGTVGIPFLVEATTNPTSTPWTPLMSGTLTNGSAYFSDTGWTNYPSRFYRIRSP